jgi:hypothetical protein
MYEKHVFLSYVVEYHDVNDMSDIIYCLRHNRYTWRVECWPYCQLEVTIIIILTSLLVFVLILILILKCHVCRIYLGCRQCPNF